MATSEQGRTDLTDDIERRQEEVLRALAQLEHRLAELLAEYTANPIAKKAA